MARASNLVIGTLTLALVAGSLGGWLGYLVAGFIGACILIAIARALRGNSVRS